MKNSKQSVRAKKYIYARSPLVMVLAWISISSLGFPHISIAQSRHSLDLDTNYFEAYPESFIVRTYSSYKYTTLELKKGNDAPRLRYRPNNNINLGIGATYRKLTLNLAYGFSFLNKDDEKGKTRRLDLQSRLYAHKWSIDLHGQFYKGYYLYPKGRAAADPEVYYTRPDLHVNLVGISAYRSFNYKRFSLRSGFTQDERQKKSAGSLLAGVEAYYGAISGDSALVPGNLSSFYDQRNIDKARIIQIGPGAGYAYTLVLPLNLYVMGCLVMNVNMSIVQEEGGSGKTDHFAVNADMLYRYSAGYNNGNWNINFFRLSNKVSAKGALSGNRYVLEPGIYRLILSKRLHPGDRGKKLLKPIDRIMGVR